MRSTSRRRDRSPADHAAARSAHSVEEYLDHVLALVAPLAAEQVALDVLATGTPARRVLAHDVRSLLDVPRFDASAMDGYAVRSADLATASTTSPVTLRVVGDIAAAPSAPGRPGSRRRPTPPTALPPSLPAPARPSAS